MVNTHKEMVIIVGGTTSGKTAGRRGVVVTMGSPPPPLPRLEKRRLQSQSISFSFLFVTPCVFFFTCSSFSPSRFTLSLFQVSWGPWFPPSDSRLPL